MVVPMMVSAHLEDKLMVMGSSTNLWEFNSANLPESPKFDAREIYMFTVLVLICH